MGVFLHGAGEEQAGHSLKMAFPLEANWYCANISVFIIFDSLNLCKTIKIIRGDALLHYLPDEDFSSVYVSPLLHFSSDEFLQVIYISQI